MKRSTYITIYKNLLKLFIEKEDHDLFDRTYKIERLNNEIFIIKYEDFIDTIKLYILIVKAYQSESNIKNVINSIFHGLNSNTYDIILYNKKNEKKEIINQLEAHLFYR